MLTSQETDHHILKLRSARMHKTRDQAYAKLFSHAFSGGTFTDLQWQRLSEDKHYKSQLCNHIGFLDPTACDPPTPMAQKMAQEYVNIVMGSEEFPIYQQPVFKTPMVAFAKAFPAQAAHLASEAVRRRMVMDVYNFNALRAYINTQDVSRLIPFDIRALYTMAIHAGPVLEHQIRDMLKAIRHKEIPHCNTSEISAAANLCNRLPQPHKAWFIANFRQIFTAPQYTKKKNRSRTLEIAFANFILLVPDAPEDLFINAVRKLSNEETHAHRNCLTRPFTIPPEEAGEPLCRMICWLEDLPDQYLKNIRGLPSEDQLRARAIEVQMGNPGLFEDTIDAMDRLDLKINGLCPHKDQLLEHLFALASRATGMQDLIKSLQAAEVPHEDSAKFVLCLSDVMRHTGTKLPKKMFDYDSSLVKPSEKEAKRLLQILKATGCP